MGRLVVVNFTSIDGVIQSPLSADEDGDGDFSRGGWAAPYSDDTVAGFMREATVNAAGLLLGRRTYEIFAAAWSQADESEPAVAAMNRMPKYVVSGSSAGLDWHRSHRVDSDLLTAVTRLKQDVDGDLVVFGSGVLVRGLAAFDLVDEYRLLVFPLVLGTGKRMFGDDGPLTHLTLTEALTSPSGVAMLTYTRAGETAPSRHRDQAPPER